MHPIALGAEGQTFSLPPDTEVALTLFNGERMVTFAAPDGSFAFHQVPPGRHVLDVTAIGFTFPSVS
jgi:hypothetical protein